MNELKNGSGEVFEAPSFAFRTLVEAMAVLPEPDWFRYRNGVSPDILRMLHPGSLIKVLVTAVGDVPLSPEFIWLEIMQMNKETKKHIGKVRTHTVRAKYHGLGYNMLVCFTDNYVIDVALNRTP